MVPDPTGAAPLNMGSTSCHANAQSACSAPPPAYGPKGAVCKQPGTGTLGGTTERGDPISIADKTTRHKVDDFTLQTTIGPFQFSHNYVGSDKNWAFDKGLGTANGPFVPKPFGSSAGYRSSMRWSHSLYSFVAPSAADVYKRQA